MGLFNFDKVIFFNSNSTRLIERPLLNLEHITSDLSQHQTILPYGSIITIVVRKLARFYHDKSCTPIFIVWSVYLFSRAIKTILR